MIGFLTIILLISFIHSGCAAVTIVRQPPGGFNLTPGQRYSMVCHHPSTNTSLVWYHNGVPVTPANTRYTVTPSAGRGGTNLKLTIKTASVLTTGRFQCSDRQDFFDYDFRMVDVSLVFNTGDATPVEIIQPSDNVTAVLEGGALVIKCRSGEDSQVSWYVNDTPIIQGPRRVITSPENQLHVLTLMNVNMHDAGTYKCQNVANYYNRAYLDVDVIKSNISHGVVISEPTRSRVFISKGATFHAICRSNQSNLLQWRHNGVVIQPSRRVIMTSSRHGDVVVTRLTMRNVQMYDGGDYQCRDGDDFTLSDRRSLIVVTPRKIIPVKIIGPSENETAVQEGGSFTITCSAGIHARLMWRLNGRPLVPRHSLTVLTSRDKTRHTQTLILTVMEVTSRDVGRYMCQDTRDSVNYDVIEMTLSKDATAITLHIEEPNTTYISVLPGNFLVIRCAGTPQTSVQWRHNGRTFDHRLRPNYALTQLIDTRRKTLSSMLTVFNVGKSESGVFTCEDTSDYLNSVSVGVRVPTPVNITSGSLLLRHGDLLQLPCQADYGTALQWLHDGDVVRPGSGISIYHAADVLSGKMTSILTFADIKDHSGTFTCRDRNFKLNSMDITVAYLEEEEDAALIGGEIQITTGHDVRVVAGTRLTLRCKASSESLNLYWTHDGDEIQGGGGWTLARANTLSGEQWLSLILDEVTDTATGTYTCTARNNQGLTDTATVDVVDGSN